MIEQMPGPDGDPRFPRLGVGAGAEGRRDGGQQGGGRRVAAAPASHLVAASLLVAGVLMLVAMLVAMATFTTGRLGGETAGFLERVRFAASLLDTSLLLLLPLALLLVHHRPVSERPDGPPVGLAHLLTVGAGALGGAFALFVLLRLVANQAGVGAQASPRAAVLFADLAALVVAVASVSWAVLELQQRRRTERPAWEPPAAGGPDGRRDSLPAAAPTPFPPSDWRPAPADPGWSDRPPIWEHHPPPAAPPLHAPLPLAPRPPPPARPTPPDTGPDRPWTPPPL